MTDRLAIFATVAGFIGISHAQSPADPRAVTFAATFEVASIKPSPVWKPGGEGSSRSIIEHSPNSLTMRNVDLSDSVQWAYGVKFYQISGANLPERARYDIRAKAAGPVPVEQLRAMLRDLLAKRFQLTLHRDTKVIPVYELTVAKRGARLPAAKADGDMSPTHALESLPRVVDGSFVFQETSMAGFAGKLALLRGIELPVLDRTGIQGVFDITLKSAASAILQKDGPSLFTLIEEQLGLKLVAAKAPVEILVVDHVEKPAAN